MPRRAPQIYLNALALISYQHARAIATAVGNAERFEALTLADQFLRGYMHLRAREFAAGAAEVRTAVLAEMAAVVPPEDIRAAFGEDTCIACGGEPEPERRGPYCLSCNEAILLGVEFPWV